MLLEFLRRKALPLMVVLSLFSSYDVNAQHQQLLPSKVDIVDTMRRVNENWIVNHIAAGDRGWARATYFEGNMALYDVYPDQVYLNYSLKWAENNDWSLYGGDATRNADNQCAGQTYIDLYRLDPQPERIEMITNNIDNMLKTDKIDDWWWVDALQMAMPVFSRLAVLNDDSTYSERMYDMYRWTKYNEGEIGLYNEDHHLWWRDSTFIDDRAPNGKNVYWARGNGWVFAAHVRTIQELDKRQFSDPHRQEYVQTFKDMAAALSLLQQSSGFWSANLLDPSFPGGPETSGTAFFTYGLAWGVNYGLLDPSTYLPVIAKGWNAMASVAIDETDRLGYIQPVGIGPSAPTSPSDNYDFGVGAFLMAASEVLKLASGPMPENISDLNLSLTASVSVSNQQTGNGATGAVDNDLTTRWSAETFPQWISLDLGSSQLIDGVEIVPLAQRAYHFTIDVSANGVQWNRVIDDSSNKEKGAFLRRYFTAQNARYVRVTIDGVEGNITSWVSLVELRVLQASADK